MPKHKYIVFLEFEDCTLAGPQEDRLAKILESSTVGEALSTAMGVECRLYLPTDAEIDVNAGHSSVHKLAAAAELAEPSIVGPNLICSCGSSNFVYVEDIQNARKVLSVEDGKLVIDGLYKTDGYDDGENSRLQCCSCCTEYALPRNLETEFV